MICDYLPKSDWTSALPAYRIFLSCATASSGSDTMPPPIEPDADQRTAIVMSLIFGAGGRRQATTSSRSIFVAAEALPFALETASFGDMPLVLMMRSTHWGFGAGLLVDYVEPPLALPSVGSREAEELRDISGLSAALLAQVLGVSRTTLHKWLIGSRPRHRHFEQLTQVLAHINEARPLFGTPIELAAWLCSPVIAGGSRPLEYLRDKRFSVFRGLLVRVRSRDAVAGTPAPVPLPIRRLSPTEFRRTAEGLRPSLSIDDHLDSNED